MEHSHPPTGKLVVENTRKSDRGYRTRGGGQVRHEHRTSVRVSSGTSVFTFQEYAYENHPTTVVTQT